MFEVVGEIRYQQLGIIGVGEGMNSTVYRAFDPYLGRTIAVKVVKKADFGNDFDSYCNEARAMFSSSHPNIVGLEYVCETKDELHLAIPLLENGSLRARIEKAPLPVKAALKATQDVLAGLGKIHASGFLHLDLKPSNVLLDDDERSLITDFSQSRKASATGTVNYPPMYKWTMPPEVLTSHVATRESDIYQVGVLLYRATNGEPFYKLQKANVSDSTKLVKLIERGRFPDTRLFLPHVSKRVRTIIRKAVRIDPRERFHSASEFASSLGRTHVALNWKVEHLGSGAYRWEATRTNKSDLEVELIQENSRWSAKVWTIEGQIRRRRDVQTAWQTNLSYPDAIAHLTEIFSHLDSQG